MDSTRVYSGNRSGVTVRASSDSDFAGDLLDYRVRIPAARSDLRGKLMQLPRRQCFVERAPQQPFAQQLDDPILGNAGAPVQCGRLRQSKGGEIFDGLYEFNYAFVLGGDGADDGRLPIAFLI